MPSGHLLKQTLFIKGDYCVDLSDTARVLKCPPIIKEALHAFDGNILSDSSSRSEKWGFPMEEVISFLERNGLLIDLPDNPPIKPELPISEIPNIDDSLSRGIKFLASRQTSKGNIGEQGYFDLWETANALLSLYYFNEDLDEGLFQKGLEFLSKHQQPSGLFFWNSRDRKQYCTETTALCGLVFLLFGYERRADKIYEFFANKENWCQVYKKAGSLLVHKYPSIVGYIANFLNHVDKELSDEALSDILRGQLHNSSWGVHASYYQSEFYAIKEIMPLLKDHSNESARRALSVIANWQNSDGGYGFATSPRESDAIPTSMALRSMSVSSSSTLEINRVIMSSLQWLINHQMRDGRWESMDSTMYAAIPDEYTSKFYCSSIFKAARKLRIADLILPRKALLLDEFPESVFYLQKVSDYSTSIFASSQALLALEKIKQRI